MMTFHEFIDKWNLIPERTNGFLSLGMTHPLELQIGYSFNGYKSLIIMNTGKVLDIPSSYAVKAVNTLLGNGEWILEFQLIHSSLEEEFLRLCWDMIEFSLDSKNPLQSLIARYLSWQKLLQYSSNEIMTFQRQKGLLGELLYLKDCLNDIVAETVVNAWKGPEGADQDFLFPLTWAEIKTVALAAQSVRISSMQQLDQEQDGKLIVYILEKSEKGEKAITIPKVIDEITLILQNDLKNFERFEMKLFKYGYRNKDREIYENNYFRMIEKREYLVNSDFPRLYRKNVANEIIACTYEFSLSSIERYRRN